MNERDIFTYMVDGKRVCVDPVRAHRVLYANLGQSLNEAINDLQRTDITPSDWSDRTERLLHAIREAFSLKPFDPTTATGVMEDPTKQVLRDFIEWCNKKKASTASAPTSPPTTVPKR